MNYSIPYYGLKRFYEQHAFVIQQLLHKSFSNGFFLDGKEIEEFEHAIAQYCHRKYAVSVGSCTDALYFSLLSLGIGKGDEVLLPSFSFISTLSAILRVGACPVFLDLQKNDFSISLNEIKQKRTSHTKALISVPLFGSTQDYSEIEQWCRENHIFFIEDAAQALGVNINNRPSGSWGNISCISFDPSKIIHAFGTGGVILTDDYSIYQYIKQLRYHGKKENNFIHVGFNSRISTFQAKLLLWQLEHINSIINQRQSIAHKYIHELSSLLFIELPKFSTNVSHTFHKFVIKSPFRDLLKKHLEANGIQVMVHYPKLLFDYSLINSYSFRAEQILHARQLTSEVLSLPLYPELTENEQLHICNCIKTFKP
ncbi:MAG: DegT/DnrJ/EryC1/StrS family aminotransferase [Bacteroidales bacterium]|nr:DegT/DnrJ/EryC1/StrS family aminotransferase [Bacteroidales bacterium]